MNRLENLRLRFAGGEAHLPLALIGIVGGLVTGLVILCFRLLAEWLQANLLPGTDPEAYEALDGIWRFTLPLCGGLMLALIYRYAPPSAYPVGVVHVMERLARGMGHLPLRNAAMQFAGAVVAIVSGHSVGREGPGIHLGAASASLLGQGLSLPNNVVRTLVACGTAASIAASFNTPIAGVIFAMEVVMMEYTIAGFTPVILAAVVATTLTRAVYGSEPAFSVPPVQMGSLWELPFIVFLGVSLGTLSALFVAGLRRVERDSSSYSMPRRMALAGVVAGFCGLVAPQVMGIGYDTVEQSLLGTLGLGTLAMIAAMKLLATGAVIGLGVPGGLIGPTLVMGTTAGAALGLIGHHALPAFGANPALYALLGMGAMMGATLRAPLAALMAILELTANPNVILPGMLAIVSGTLTATVLFRQESVFVTLLRLKGIDYFHDPVAGSLNRRGVAALMSRRISSTERHLTGAAREALFNLGPQWIVVSVEGAVSAVFPADDLAARLRGAQPAPGTDTVDLFSLEATRLPATTVPVQATLGDALEAMDRDHADAACIARRVSARREDIYGVITRAAIISLVWRSR